MTKDTWPLDHIVITVEVHTVCCLNPMHNIKKKPQTHIKNIVSFSCFLGWVGWGCCVIWAMCEPSSLNWHLQSSCIRIMFGKSLRLILMMARMFKLLLEDSIWKVFSGYYKSNFATIILMSFFESAIFQELLLYKTSRNECQLHNWFCAQLPLISIGCIQEKYLIIVPVALLGRGGLSLWYSKQMF